MRWDEEEEEGGRDGEGGWKVGGGERGWGRRLCLRWETGEVKWEGRGLGVKEGVQGRS